MKKFLRVCLFVLVIVMLTNGLCVFASSSAGSIFLTYNKVSEKISQAENKIKSSQGYVANSLKTTTTYECKQLGFYVDSQLINYYFSKNNVILKNVCTEVAIANILANLKSNNQLVVSKSVENMFCEIVDYAMSKKYYTISGGTKTSCEKALFLKTLESFVKPGVLSECTSKSKLISFVKKEAVKQNNVGFPVLFSMSIPGQNLNHTISIVGVTTYKLSYKKTEKVLLWNNTKTYTEEYTYYIVENGSAPGAMYISESDLKDLGLSAYSITIK